VTTETDIIKSALDGYLSDAVYCNVPEGEGHEIACSTPLRFPNGDHIQVWVDHRVEHRLEVSDLGIASLDFLTHPPQDAKALSEAAAKACRRLGVGWEQHRVVELATLDSVADAVWRVALAASEIAALSAHFQPRRRRREKELVRLIERDLVTRSVPVEREHEIRGLSGHRHHVTLYVPRTEAVMEPVSSQGHWNQVSTVYAKFGDLSQANDYRLFSVVDDRAAPLAPDLTNMLVQVSKVVQWSERDVWVPSIG
jgi:hypothetical protein